MDFGKVDNNYSYLNNPIFYRDSLAGTLNDMCHYLGIIIYIHN